MKRIKAPHLKIVKSIRTTALVVIVSSPHFCVQCSVSMITAIFPEHRRLKPQTRERLIPESLRTTFTIPSVAQLHDSIQLQLSS